MRILVVYKSRTGFTEKYAQWISEDLSAELFKVHEIDIDKMLEYDVIIYGGGLYASGIGGVKLITKNLDKLNGKKIVVFGCGATPPREKDIIEIKKANFEEEQIDKLTFFYLRGGFDYSKLSPVFKIIMTLFKIKLKSDAKSNPDAKGMLASYEKPMDFTRKSNIEPLINHIKEQ